VFTARYGLNLSITQSKVNLRISRVKCVSVRPYVRQDTHYIAQTIGRLCKERLKYVQQFIVKGTSISANAPLLKMPRVKVLRDF
jgi:hypothetical protein